MRITAITFNIVGIAFQIHNAIAATINNKTIDSIINLDILFYLENIPNKKIIIIKAIAKNKIIFKIGPKRETTNNAIP